MLTWSGGSRAGSPRRFALAAFGVGALVGALLGCSSGTAFAMPTPSRSSIQSGARQPGSPARAQPPAVKLFEYPVPLQGHNWVEEGIAAGSDGAMWFTAARGDGKGDVYASVIVRVTNDQKFTIYKLPPQTAPGEIALGSDGALWFTESTGVGRITPDGKVIEFGLPANFGGAGSITLGRDGAMWFTAADHFGVGIEGITPKGVFKRAGCSAHDCDPFEITTGPDGALWTTDGLFNGLDRFSPTSASTSVSVDGIVAAHQSGLTTGPDGALWICDYVGGAIDRYAVGSKSLTVYHIPGSYPTPNHIVTGSDGALWFTNFQDNEVDRIDTSGHVRRYPTPEPGIAPNYIAPNPDGSLWFTTVSNEIGHIVFS